MSPALPRSLAFERTWGWSDRCLNCDLENIARSEQPQVHTIFSKIQPTRPNPAVHPGITNWVQILIRFYPLGSYSKLKTKVFRSSLPQSEKRKKEGRQLLTLCNN